MLRYISCVYDPTSASAEETAVVFKRRLHTVNHAWTAVLDRPGLMVYCTGSSYEGGGPVLLSEADGIILGTLFERNRSAHDDTARRTTVLDAKTSSCVIATAGKSLINSHWGSYVLFLKPPHARNVMVLRGPMGRLPCFWTTFKGITILFSTVEDCVALNLHKFSVNWDCIRAQAAGGDYLTNETGVNEIATLISGECATVRDGKVSLSAYWSPSAIQAAHYAGTSADAARILEGSTQQSINALVSPHKTVLLQLSGGLDSSILLGCMNRAPTKLDIVAVNFWSRGAGGDERTFARSMAAKTGVEPLELERDRNVDLRRLLTCARTGNPVLNFCAYDQEPRLVRLAKERGATAIFTGEIGDDIFGHAAFPGTLAECLNVLGASWSFFRAAVDYADLMRVSVWKAVGQAVQHRRWARRQPYWSYFLYKRQLGIGGERNLVTLEVVREYERQLERFIHPWFRDVQGMPFGRAMLVFALVMATSTWSHSPFGESAGSLFSMPLANQPLVEAFFTIPAHFHFRAGENGAVARQAFEAILSDAVLRRGTGKGGPGLWLHELFARNRQILRELLLDGIMVREQILDRTKLEAAISGAVSKSQVGIGELAQLLYVECWLRRWTGLETRAVA
jgi:asparagine synthase (glutamine-hydrolysing)